jgi:hypothetical protein
LLMRRLTFLVLLLISPFAKSADWGGLQAAMLSFTDVGAMAGKTMEMCEGTELTDQERDRLRGAYQNFKEVHLPQKDIVRESVTLSLKNLGTEGDKMLKGFQDPKNQAGFSEQFLTEKVKGARGYCAVIFFEMLKGSRMALNFNDYANQIRERGHLNVFLPKN